MNEENSTFSMKIRDSLAQTVLILRNQAGIPIATRTKLGWGADVVGRFMSVLHPRVENHPRPIVEAFPVPVQRDWWRIWQTSSGWIHTHMKRILLPV